MVFSLIGRITLARRVGRAKSLRGCARNAIFRFAHPGGVAIPDGKNNGWNLPVLIVCLDLEGVLIPEIWIGLAQRTGIDALRATTRDVPDYDTLMRQRLKILDDQGLGLPDIHAVVAGMAPLPGARDFLDWIRDRWPLVILSDTFYEFVDPLMAALGRPTLFCHGLKVAQDGHIDDYQLRLADHKRASIEAFRALNFDTVAIGDSFNDTTMLAAADTGILFHAPENIIAEFPQYPAMNQYDELKSLIQQAAEDSDDR
jgi:phosphoserine / homoserine phosphotransferase